MRVVTRPDFDGVVCAVLLMDALQIPPPVLWVQPSDMQHRRVDIQNGDVIANLPFHENCTLWFDHHYSNRPKTPVNGVFKIAPSAAGLVYEHYRERLDRDYGELVRQTDRIDSADLTLDEILHPQNHPYVLLSMTITNHDPSEARYWEHLVALLRSESVNAVMDDPQVSQRCRQVVAANIAYEKALIAHTTLVDHISVTDFRGLDPAPNGNRFLVYSLFPDCTVNVKIVFDGDHLASIKVGHSILNRGCEVNVGKMLSAFEGGGHPGAGACRFSREKAPDYLARIIEILRKNVPV
ncbi:exopolyphosphatase [Desulfosarcina alkanivorans]|uniref:Exopolyphosphatase n=1 Tax=Desulfosarcina alkanivorans TaxID=571177 RepID=A0A5K7YL53_9BACT|nr:exopolyphosphatase [Desulfosarcina alkanivorans]BBO69946.1 exopolyphosphatase [Desulfosarcina alkanivorans]